jgi:hypothetical protein
VTTISGDAEHVNHHALPLMAVCIYDLATPDAIYLMHAEVRYFMGDGLVDVFFGVRVEENRINSDGILMETRLATKAAAIDVVADMHGRHVDAVLCIDLGHALIDLGGDTSFQGS